MTSSHNSQRFVTGNLRQTERVLRALANQRRLSILELLADTKAYTVGDIAARTHIPFMSTSQHLQVLETNGVLERRRDYNNMYYQLAPKSAIVEAVLVSLRPQKRRSSGWSSVPTLKRALRTK